MDFKKSDFYYDLPECLIAQHPVEPRNASRMMEINRITGKIRHQHFYDLEDLLQPGDLLILNDSRVLPARLYGEKEETGSFVEFLLLHQIAEKQWEIICRPGKKCRPGAKFSFGGGKLSAEVLEIKPDGNRIVQFTCDGNFYEILDEIGQMPLPPYITEKLQDKERYQTVYSRELGSAAAPTAGLHFTKEMLAVLQEKGIRLAYVTLHVGLGTFRPVKEENILEHHM
ncbi:MAG: S-adenosylmethionine:tRNA ribosyltransferase-isomerase, partial [Oscillospiraceae bacterium]|nr:S-adenosylmethionine:tRNA ribosyltransferase-isomerase [Oscillospiraceae bacterium]